MSAYLKTAIYYLLWIAGFLLISFGIGQVTQSNMEWYNTLPKSPLNPPRLAFPIVWTTLYIMLAIVGGRLYLLARPQGIFTHKCFLLFILYMAFNWAWSFIFFGAHYIVTGFIWIVISDAILLALIIALRTSNDKNANLLSALCIPTFLWGLFAAYLNGFIAFKVIFN
jgi:tryptophan-rich sensory protein